MFAVHKTARISLRGAAQGLHDALTGLPNRKYLLRTLDEASSRAEAPRRSRSRLLDLDRFKEVNDTLGHHVGDRLLELVAERIQGVLRAERPGRPARRRRVRRAAARASPTTARAAEVAQRVRDALIEPFQLEDVLLELEASIGIAVYPDARRRRRARSCAAPTSRCTSPRSTHTGVEVYDPARDRNSTDRLGLLAALRRAIDAGELDLHYQPKVAARRRRGRRRRGPRALEPPGPRLHPARRVHPAGRDLRPHAPAHRLRHRHARSRRSRAGATQGCRVAVAVNVSARDLHGTELARTVSEALAKHRVPAPLLKLELTERTLMAEHTRVLDTLDRARGARRRAEPGRLRHRLLVDVHAQAAAGQRDQGRPVVRQQAGGRRARTRRSSARSSSSPTHSACRPSPRASRPTRSGSSCRTWAATPPRAGTSAGRCRPTRPRPGCASTRTLRPLRPQRPATPAAWRGGVGALSLAAPPSSRMRSIPAESPSITPGRGRVTSPRWPASTWTTSTWPGWPGSST